MEQPDHLYENQKSQHVVQRESELLGINDDSPTLGIALSGGGIRSASFGLGVLQALRGHKILQNAHYLSTVSGGGYIGSALTWFNKKQRVGDDDFPFFGKKHFGARTLSDGEKKGTLVDFIRQHGNYLTPGKLLNLPSALAVVIRSFLYSIAIYLTLLVIVISFLGILAYLPSHYSPKFLGYNHVVEWVKGWQKPVVEEDAFVKTASLWIEEDCPFSSEVPQKIITTWSDRVLLHFSVLIAAVFLGLFLVLTTIFPGILKIFRRCSELSSDKQNHPFWSNPCYKLRTCFQKISGVLLLFFVGFSVLATVPIVEAFISQWIASIGVTGYLSGILAALARMRKHMGGIALLRKAWVGDLFFKLGAVVFAYVSLVLAYHLSYQAGVPVTANGCLQLKTFLLLGGLVIAVLAFGCFADINDSTIGKMYRDRLMETFLPDHTTVSENKWQPAQQADHAYLEDMCKDINKNIIRPYHLINTNVILVGSSNERYKWRGGDSFLLSPEFCGSDATGYVTTKNFMKRDQKKGMTLATAMAVSGAAVNPHAGVGGVGPTRDYFVSFMMTVFNIRLGIWTTNPFQGGEGKSPNYFWPGLCGLLGFGYKEDSTFVELSDGGHFENLGLYELIRRRVTTIIVSDAGQDKDFNFGDLANAIERVRADFGVIIRFWPEDAELGRLLPASLKGDPFTEKFQLAQRGYATGSILYPEVGNMAQKEGKIYLIKPTLLAGLPADIYGYKARHADFPAQTTSDQFFDESQFDAYRELGYRAAEPLAELLSKGE